MVKHDLGASEYPVRVRECQQAVEAIRAAYPAVSSLRDVSSEALERVRDTMPDVVYRRARHVAGEDERVVKFTAACEAGNLHEMGRLFLASHRSLQHDYEVSAEELDFLVDTASDFTGVYGARMTGGGFGGCTVNLVSPDRVEAFKTHITAAYLRRYNMTPRIYDCIPAAGAGEV
jgi:galactokinase